MSKQSSVEWLAQAIYDKMKMKGDGKVFQGILDEAKALHRKEIAKTWDDSLDNLKARGMNEMRAYTDFDEYYNETFGGQDNE